MREAAGRLGFLEGGIQYSSVALSMGNVRLFQITAMPVLLEGEDIDAACSFQVVRRIPSLLTTPPSPDIQANRSFMPCHTKPLSLPSLVSSCVLAVPRYRQIQPISPALAVKNIKCANVSSTVTMGPPCSLETIFGMGGSIRVCPCPARRDENACSHRPSVKWTRSTGRSSTPKDSHQRILQ